jgi:hypothetical protein
LASGAISEKENEASEAAVVNELIKDSETDKQIDEVKGFQVHCPLKLVTIYH